jgi:hypothetical protein
MCIEQVCEPQEETSRGSPTPTAYRASSWQVNLTGDITP